MQPHYSSSGRQDSGTEPQGGYRAQIAAWAPGRAVAAAGEVLERMMQVGVKVPSSCRIARARERIASADKFNAQFGLGDQDTLRLMTEAHRCIFEGLMIAKVFVAPTATELEKLRAMLDGPDVPRRTQTDPARAAQAELLTSALFRVAGYTTTIAEPDLIVHREGERLGVAVKRVTSDRQFEKRVQEARNQLTRSNLNGFIVVHADSYLTEAYLDDSAVNLSLALWNKVVKWLDYIDIQTHSNPVRGLVGIATSMRLVNIPHGQAFEGLVHFHPRFVTESTDAAIQAVDNHVRAIVASMAASLPHLVT